MVSIAVTLLIGAKLYLNLHSSAYTQMKAWAESRPTDAAAIQQIAEQPTVKWFGDWNTNITSDIDAYVTKVKKVDAMPTFVLYNIPNRDCGNYSSGGSADEAAYLAWIQAVVDGIGQRRAVVILEPDALALDCLYTSSHKGIAQAVTLLKTDSNIIVYLDAGHPNWNTSKVMAKRLRHANISEANGFALNVSNFYKTKRNIKYGKRISGRVHGKHFIIDTGRNGNGWNGEWCNPSGMHIGHVPTTQTGHKRVDAFLWVKPPGESDGECNGGPAAGTWWGEYALGLVRG